MSRNKTLRLKIQKEAKIVANKKDVSIDLKDMRVGADLKMSSICIFITFPDVLCVGRGKM